MGAVCSVPIDVELDKVKQRTPYIPAIYRYPWRLVSTPTPLMQAVESADLTNIESLIAEFAGCGLPGGETALMQCALHPDVEKRQPIRTASKLIKFNVDDSTEDVPEIETEPASLGQLVELLAAVEGGVSDLTGRTALMRAAEVGHAWAVTVLAEVEATAADHTGKTALMLAARAGEEGAVDLLLDFEAGLVDKQGRTALMHACEAGRVDCARMLLWEAGRADHNGVTALQLAAEAGNAELVDLLASKELEMTRLSPLHYAVHSQRLRPDEPAVDLWLSRWSCRADVRGNTALMHAAALGRLSWVQRLVVAEHGCRNNERMTALIVAAAAGHPECVEVLLRYEAGCMDTRGNTALWNAIYRHLGVLPDPAGTSPGARTGHLECALLLLEHECHVRDYAGHTPLMAVAAVGALDRQGGWTEAAAAALARAVVARTGAEMPVKKVRKTVEKSEVDQDEDESGVGVLPGAPVVAGAGDGAGDEEQRQEQEEEGELIGSDDDLETSFSHIYTPSELLVSAGSKSTDGLTALWYALTAGHIDTATYLLTLKPELSAKVRGRTPLMAKLICHSTHDMADWLTSLPPAELAKFTTTVDWDDRTPLHHAAAAGAAGAVELLAPIFAGRRDVNGQTALMLAVRACSLACVNHLVVREGTVRDNDGCTALHAAVALTGVQPELQLALVQALTRVCAGAASGRSETALMRAVGAGAWAVAAEVTVAPPEVGKRDCNGRTALEQLLAKMPPGDATKELPTEAEFLVELEGKLETEDGYTTLWLALNNGNNAVARQILRICGESAAEASKRGLTPLMAAVLLQDVDLADKHRGLAGRLADGACALGLAARAGIAVSQWLIDAECNIKDQRGRTPAALVPDNAPELQALFRGKAVAKTEPATRNEATNDAVDDAPLDELTGSQTEHKSEHQAGVAEEAGDADDEYTEEDGETEKTAAPAPEEDEEYDYYEYEYDN